MRSVRDLSLHVITHIHPCHQGDIANAYGSSKIPNMFLIGTDGRIKAVQAGLEDMEDMEWEVCMAAAEKHSDAWCGPEGLTGKTVASLRPVKGHSLWAESWMDWITWRIQRYACMQKTRDMLLGSGAKANALTHLQKYEAGERSAALLAVSSEDCVVWFSK